MTTLSFPLLATVRASFRDVFGDIKGFFKISWLMWLMIILLVELPMSFLADDIHKNADTAQSMADFRAQMQGGAETGQAEIDQGVTSTDQAVPGAAGSKSRVTPMQLMMVMGLNLVQILLLMRFILAWVRALVLHEQRGELIRPIVGKREFYLLWTSMKASAIMMPLTIFSFYPIAMLMMGMPLSQFDILIAAGFLVGLVYLQARFSLSYVLSSIGENEEPVRQSWLLTKGQALRIIGGNFLVMLPLFLVITLVTFVLSIAVAGLVTSSGDAETAVVQVPYWLRAIYKGIGTAFLLVVTGVITAFYARVYATLVRQS